MTPQNGERKIQIGEKFRYKIQDMVVFLENKDNNFDDFYLYNSGQLHRLINRAQGYVEPKGKVKDFYDFISKSRKTVTWWDEKRNVISMYKSLPKPSRTEVLDFLDEVLPKCDENCVKFLEDRGILVYELKEFVADVNERYVETVDETKVEKVEDEESTHYIETENTDEVVDVPEEEATHYIETEDTNEVVKIEEEESTHYIETENTEEEVVTPEEDQERYVQEEDLNNPDNNDYDDDGDTEIGDEHSKDRALNQHKRMLLDLGDFPNTTDLINAGLDFADANAIREYVETHANITGSIYVVEQDTMENFVKKAGMVKLRNIRLRDNVLTHAKFDKGTANTAVPNSKPKLESVKTETLPVQVQPVTTERIKVDTKSPVTSLSLQLGKVIFEESMNHSMLTAYIQLHGIEVFVKEIAKSYKDVLQTALK